MHIIIRNMATALIGVCLQLSILLTLFSGILAVGIAAAEQQADECIGPNAELEDLRRDVQALAARIDSYTGIQAGRIPDRAVSGQLFRVALDQPTQVQAEIQRLELRRQSLSTAASPPDLPEKCRYLEKDWQALLQKKQQAELKLTQLSLEILQLNQLRREFLQRQLALQERLFDIQEQVTSGLRGASDQEQSSEDQLVLLQKMAAKEQVLLQSWWQLTLSSQDQIDKVNRFWLQTLIRDAERVDTLSSHTLSGLESQDVQIAEIGQRLADVHRHILLGLTEWRNQILKQAGWSTIILQVIEPQDFFPGLYHELKMAPAVLWHRVSQPGIQTYREAVRQDTLTATLTSWILQLFGLLILGSLLIRSAAQATSWLAGLQQQWLGKLESATGHSILSGLFWMLKPNASWIYILLVAQASTLVFADHWHILNLLAPLATLYAAFRALRIILEWGFSRTYTRSGLFLSNHMSEQLVVDSQRMTWIVVYLGFSWALAYASGGGYLLYLVSLLALFLFVGVLWLLMLKHASAVNKLTYQVLGLKLDVAADERSWWLRWLSKLTWPFIFLLVQLLDILYSLNQKLMVFDMYRSFSVKLLRVRLDSKVEEVEEDDGAEPDQSYSDWMLREAPDNLLFDIGDVSSLLTPLKNWYSEKTDENLMVVIGESGSGKSTLIRRLPGMWTDSPVKVLDVQPKTIEPQLIFDQIADSLGIERFTDVAGLVRQDANITPQVLVIDSAHNLFLAEVGYLSAYKALLECMNAHLENVFWLVVMHSPSWNYLNCVFSREQRITHVFKMPRWSPMDIRKLILSRHQGGRRRLKYNEMLLSAAASSESSSVRAADSRVFNILWEQCGGNPLAAIELWLNAVKVKGRVAEVGVPQRPPSNLLNGLKDDLFFVYTAIVAHSELSTAEIMRVTHFSEPVVRHAIKQGINLGMIIRDESKRYKVDPYWYGTLSGFLHRKNMLWD